MMERIERIDRIEEDVDSSICIKVSHQSFYYYLQITGCGLFVSLSYSHSHSSSTPVVRIVVRGTQLSLDKFC